MGLENQCCGWIGGFQLHRSPGERQVWRPSTNARREGSPGMLFPFRFPKLLQAPPRRRYQDIIPVRQQAVTTQAQGIRAQQESLLQREEGQGRSGGGSQQQGRKLSTVVLKRICSTVKTRKLSPRASFREGSLKRQRGRIIMEALWKGGWNEEGSKLQAKGRCGCTSPPLDSGSRQGLGVNRNWALVPLLGPDQKRPQSHPTPSGKDNPLSFAYSWFSPATGRGPHDYQAPPNCTSHTLTTHLPIPLSGPHPIRKDINLLSTQELGAPSQAGISFHSGSVLKQRHIWTLLQRQGEPLLSPEGAGLNLLHSEWQQC